MTTTTAATAAQRHLKGLPGARVAEHDAFRRSQPSSPRRSSSRTALPFLLTDDDGQPLSDYQLARAVTEPVLEAGVALLNGQVVRRTTNDAHWTRRQGISLQQL